MPNAIALSLVTPYVKRHGCLPQRGFTLIEIMVVIVILSIFAGMMALSVGGSDNRKNLAFYEHLQSNLDYIRLLSLENMQPYGLAIKLAQGDTPNQLVVVKLDNAFTNRQVVANFDTQSASNAKPTWQLEPTIAALEVPKNIQVRIEPLDNPSMSAPSTEPLATWLVGNEAPPVVWFGTGEATPVQISVQKTNPDKQVYPVAKPLIISQAGALEVAK